jgi:NDP-sugar pyrophosphorylase family protein
MVIAVGGKGKRISVNLKKEGFTTSKIFFKINGKSILSHLIDMSLALKFQHIFLLSSYYETDLRLFLKENYPNNKHIIPIYGGQKGKKLGVPWLLYSIKNRLHKPFIYSDGNILYKSSIIQKIRKNDLGPTLINLVLSIKDYAPTHSRIVRCNKNICEISVRLPLFNDKQKKIFKEKQYYYSLGLMVLSGSIFSSLPHFAYRKDLDCIVSDVFKSNKTLVRGTIYQGKWIALHTIQDINKLIKKD